MDAGTYLEQTWHGIEAGLREKGFGDIEVQNSRIVFEGGLGAALVAIMKHQATAADIDREMKWIGTRIS